MAEDNKHKRNRPTPAQPIQNGKLPPQATSLEAGVLGALLTQKDAILDVSDILTPESFYHERHQHIYNSVMELNSNSQPIDLLTVAQKLLSKGLLDIVGGAHYLTQLTNSPATYSKVEYHAGIIEEKKIARDVIRVSSELITNAYDETTDVFELTEKMVTEAYNIGDVKKGSVGLSTIELLRRAKERIYNAKEFGGITGIRSGLIEQDIAYGGYQDSNLYIKAARPAMGKLNPLTEPVLTPSGWVKMGEIKQGSIVSCPVSGLGIKVLNIYPQSDLDIYKITFNDGSYSECCNDHLWLIQTQTDVKKGKDRVVDVNWMLKTGVLDTRNKSRFRIPLTNPVEFTKKEVLLDPYLLGLLIADGYLPCKSQTTLTCHSDDAEERFDTVKKLIPEDVTIRLDKQYGSVKARKIIFSKEIKKYLFDLGLLGKKSRDKFIPEDYIYNTVHIRKRLLSALMDTDGSCFINKTGSSKQASYSTMSSQLRYDIIEVVKSLGGKASASSETREKYKGGVCWNIGVKTPFNPFTKQKKKDIFNSMPYKETFTKTIRSIKFLRKDDGQCISVDSKKHLYITRDYTVTHNTGLAMSEANHIAYVENKNVLFFSIEMSEDQLTDRSIAVHTEISLNKTKSGKMSEDDWAIYNEKTSEMMNDILRIVDIPGISLNKVRKISKKHKLKFGLDIIFIDYLQLMTDPKKGNSNRQEEVSRISVGLKGLAKELQVPVIALAQLSRDVEKRGGEKIPQLSDLRESGSIEQDADAVQFLHRHEYYGITEDADGNSTHGRADLINAKNRHGAVDTLHVQFIAHLTKFKDIGANDSDFDSFDNSALPISQDFHHVPTSSQDNRDFDDDAPF